MYTNRIYSTASELLVWADAHPSDAAEFQRIAAELLNLTTLAEHFASLLQDSATQDVQDAIPHTC